MASDSASLWSPQDRFVVIVGLGVAGTQGRGVGTGVLRGVARAAGAPDELGESATIAAATSITMRSTTKLPKTRRQLSMAPRRLPVADDSHQLTGAYLGYDSYQPEPKSIPLNRTTQECFCSCWPVVGLINQ